MTKSRLEAFSDGVLAVVITIMVLEIKVPHEADVAALLELCPKLLGYVLSFIYIGIYWNNHHHLMHLTTRIDGRVMWANLHLLFWLSLVPMTTGWVGEHPGAPLPTAIYGVMLFMSGVGWLILQYSLVRANGGKESALAKALGSDRKGNLSAVLYLSAIALSFVRPWIAQVIYTFVALMWLVPDRRIEKQIAGDEEQA
jgi:uncharacterized membrane protein